MEQKKISSWALLDLAARNKETLLWNACLKAKRQTEQGAQGKSRACLIPLTQNEPLPAVKMTNKLLMSGASRSNRPGMYSPSRCSVQLRDREIWIECPQYLDEH